MLSYVRGGQGGWFPAVAIAELAEVQRALGSRKTLTEMAAELRANAGTRYTKPADRKSEESTDRHTVTTYFHELLAALYPLELQEALTKPRSALDVHDARALLKFLECNPYFFRSGYKKQRAVHRLPLAKPSTDERERALRVLRSCLMDHSKPVVPDWPKLARVTDREDLITLLREAEESSESRVLQNAARLRQYLTGLETESRRRSG